MSTQRVDLGHDHSFAFREMDGEICGIEYHHKDKNGKDCKGWVPFNGSSWGRDFGNKGWDVQSLDPLTISPSLLCRICGDHGFIRGGKWVPA